MESIDEAKEKFLKMTHEIVQFNILELEDQFDLKFTEEQFEANHQLVINIMHHVVAPMLKDNVEGQIAYATARFLSAHHLMVAALQNGQTIKKVNKESLQHVH